MYEKEAEDIAKASLRAALENLRLAAELAPLAHWSAAIGADIDRMGDNVAATVRDVEA